jgi:hypothetical protein
MIIRRSHPFTTGLVFAALFALPMLTNGCTQATDDTSATSSAVGGGSSSGASTDEAGKPRGMFLLADVVDGTGTHALVPFVLPPPPAPPTSTDGAKPADGEMPAPPPCIVHRKSDADVAMAPPPPPKDGTAGVPAGKEGAPPPPDGEMPKDARPGPVLLQIAVFATEAGATAGAPKEGETPVLPEVVVQCFAKPGEKRVDVPKSVLDDAFAGLADGATARIALAGFPMPPPGSPKDGATSAPPPPAPEGATPPEGAPKGPPPAVGRGVFGIAKLSDTSKIDSLLTTLTLP